MKIVFLHGIGDGDPDYEWLDGLNRGLEQAGFAPVQREQVIAPRYSSYLKTAGRSSSMPPITYKPKDDGVARREFERRQARVQRRLQLQHGVRTFGFHVLPDFAWDWASRVAVSHFPALDLDQVRGYIRDDKVRADVMRHILDHLPSYGEIILVAHSLGSVIAIDLLDHLPEKLHVRRFITIGSPANIRALHEGSERLLKKFPYAHVDDWSNFLNVGDIVTGGRGLATTFPGAQDFMLSGVSGHNADAYLGDPAVAGLVAEVLYPSTELVPASADIAIRMTEAEASALLLQHFATAVAHNIKEDEQARRYRATLRILRDDLGAQIALAGASGALLAPEMIELMNGKLPPLPHRWELHEALNEMVVLALTNCVEPYDIDPGEAQMHALADIAVQLGFQRHTGETVARAIRDVQRCVAGRGGVPWGKVLTAAAGVALLAAGPVGLAVAAPAGVFGAAAITSSLAAFGPGGMVGGLAMLGGLAGTGAATATAAAVSGSEPEGPRPNLVKLMMRVAVEYARKLLDLPHDPTLWYQLTDFENQVSAAVNRLAPFDDAKSPKLVQLKVTKVAMKNLLAFMIEKGLSPEAITTGEPEAIES
jgi:pimeloyl-ACP methyl ester carboxylesterase